MEWLMCMIILTILYGFKSEDYRIQSALIISVYQGKLKTILYMAEGYKNGL